MRFTTLHLEFDRTRGGAGGLKGTSGKTIIWACEDGASGRINIAGLPNQLASLYVSRKLGIRFEITETRLRFEIEDGDSGAILETTPRPPTFNWGDKYVVRYGFGRHNHAL